MPSGAGAGAGSRTPIRRARISGAWANTTDSLVDAGLAIAPAWTNERIAEQGTAIAPTVPHEMQRLATTATAITFGHADESWDRVDDAVAAWRAVDGSILADRTLLATDPLASQPALAASLDALAGHRLTFRTRAAGRATRA